MIFSKSLKADSIPNPKRDKLEYKGNKFYENDDYIPKRDLIYHSSSDQGAYLRSKRTGQIYRASELRRVYGYFPYTL